MDDEARDHFRSLLEGGGINLSPPSHPQPPVSHYEVADHFRRILLSRGVELPSPHSSTKKLSQSLPGSYGLLSFRDPLDDDEDEDDDDDPTVDVPFPGRSVHFEPEDIPAGISPIHPYRLPVAEPALDDADSRSFEPLPLESHDSDFRSHLILDDPVDPESDSESDAEIVEIPSSDISDDFDLSPAFDIPPSTDTIPLDSSLGSSLESSQLSPSAPEPEIESEPEPETETETVPPGSSASSVEDLLETVQTDLDLQRNTTHEVSSRFETGSKSYVSFSENSVDQIDELGESLHETLDRFTKRVFTEDELPVLLRRLGDRVEDMTSGVVERMRLLSGRFRQFHEEKRLIFAQRIAELVGQLKEKEESLEELKERTNELDGQKEEIQNRLDETLEIQGELREAKTELEELVSKLELDMDTLQTTELELNRRLAAATEEKSSALAQVSSLREDISGLRQQLSSKAQEIGRLEASEQTLRETSESSKDQIAELTQKIEEQTSESLLLSQQVAKLKSELEVSLEKVSSGEDLVETLRLQNAENIKMMQTANREHAAAMQTEVSEKTALEAELERLRNLLAQTQEIADRKKDSDSRIVILEERISSNERELESLKSAASVDQKTIAQLEAKAAQVEDLCSSRDRALSDLRSAEIERARLEEKAAGLTRNLADSVESCVSLKKEVQASREQLSSFQRDLGQARASHQDAVKEMQRDMTETRASFELSLTQECETTRRLEEEKQELIAESSRLQEDIRLLKEAVTRVERETSNTQEELQQMTHECAKVRSEYVTLQQESEETFSALAGSRQDTETLKRELSQAEESARRLRSDLESSKMQLTASSLSMDRLREKNERSSEKHRQEGLRKEKDFEQKMNALKRSNAAVKKELDGFRQQQLESQREIEDLRGLREREIVEHRTQIETLRQKDDARHDEMADLLDGRRKEIEELRELLLKKDDDHEAAMRRLKSVARHRRRTAEEAEGRYLRMRNWLIAVIAFCLNVFLMLWLLDVVFEYYSPFKPV